jgi:hypothetical protein
MNKITILIFIFLFALGSSVTKGEDQNFYSNEEIGVSFSYPKTLSINNYMSTKSPLSVVFMHGTPPFAASILFKEITETNNLEEFIMKERKDQEADGYRDQIKEQKHTIGGKYSAIEFIRTSEIGNIYYFVFLAQKSKKLFAFWHVTTEVADPQGEAIKAYNAMINSLKIVP